MYGGVIGGTCHVLDRSEDWIGVSSLGWVGKQQRNGQVRFSTQSRGTPQVSSGAGNAAPSLSEVFHQHGIGKVKHINSYFQLKLHSHGHRLCILVDTGVFTD